MSPEHSQTTFDPTNIQGEAILPEYPPASIEQLIASWQNYDASANMQPLPDVYGIYRQISLSEQKPWALASVDLCEVVRLTKNTTEIDTNYDIEGQLMIFASIPHNDYLSASDRDEVSAKVILSMNQGRARPVKGIEHIELVLNEWRQAGVYVVANTSTLKGCELATLDYLKKYVQGGFDGILLPGNHENRSGEMNKVKAVKSLLSQPGFEEVRSLVHIDDNPPHQFEFEKSRSSLPNLKTISPYYLKNSLGDFHSYPNTTLASQHATDPELNPMQAIEDADRWLREQNFEAR